MHIGHAEKPLPPQGSHTFQHPARQFSKVVLLQSEMRALPRISKPHSNGGTQNKSVPKAWGYMSSLHPIKNFIGVLQVLLAHHPSAALEAVGGLIFNNTTKHKQRISLLEITFKKSCQKPQPSANGSRYLSKGINCTGNPEQSKETWASCFEPSASSPPSMGAQWHGTEGQGQPGPGAAAGSVHENSIWSSFQTTQNIWPSSLSFEIADRNSAPQ